MVSKLTPITLVFGLASIFSSCFGMFSSVFGGPPPTPSPLPILFVFEWHLNDQIRPQCLESFDSFPEPHNTQQPYKLSLVKILNRSTRKRFGGRRSMLSSYLSHIRRTRFRSFHNRLNCFHLRF